LTEILPNIGSTKQDLRMDSDSDHQRIMSFEDHYKILGVRESASADDIKKAYRKLALKFHPDKNLQESVLAKEAFQRVYTSYDILSNEDNRSQYD
jgi:curved DNA-binding protein